MNSKQKEILSYYENFRIYKGTLSGKEGFFDFQPPSSLHSEITSFAYGIREKNRALSLRNHPCKSHVDNITDTASQRFFVKLKAQLFDWEKCICGIKLSVNGNEFYKNEREFFETVNLGWPVIYIPIPHGLVTEGENIFEITQYKGETPLLVASLDLISLPAASPGKQLTLKTAVRINDIFALSFFASGCEVSVENHTNCEIIGISKSALNPEHTIVQIAATGENPVLTLNIGDKTIDAVMPEVFPENSDFCMIGTDSDDHRHDDSHETDRILEIFANTNMGNFWQARPQKLRNYYDLSGEETWKNRIDFLRAYQTMMSLADSENVMPYFSDACDKQFLGTHFHEAYLYFCSALLYDKDHCEKVFLDVEALLGSESFGDSRKRFCEALKKMYETCCGSRGLASVGSPSLLTIYEASSGFERVTIEPVSNINLLIGAVRGVNPKMWGAHVPTDWYFGEPNDATKARKFLIAMELLYIHGANYIYAENALFKTNAFSRKDWDDDFCVLCRNYLRDFYDYTIRNPREGKLKSNLAVLYGNNEYFLWHHDNRIAELGENDDWDITVWGKWKDNRHHKCWRAIDEWLPPAERQNSRENILNLNLFSGTPYGSVDVIAYESDYSKYKSLVLLGWNTYESGFDNKLYSYVENGGTAFVSYCHFNKTDACTGAMEYASTEALGIHCREIISTLGNISFENQNVILADEEFTIVKCDCDGEKIVVDESGNTIIARKVIGKGTLYFGAFADYNCPDSKLKILKYVMNLIGRATADTLCSNPDICFTERITDEGTTVIDIINVCANSSDEEDFELTFKDGSKIYGKAKPGEIKKIIR